MSKQLNVALIGNPNTGKTSVFNALTGLNQKVGNLGTLQDDFNLLGTATDNESGIASVEYTLNGENYKVGELKEDYASLDDQEVIVLKMLIYLPRFFPILNTCPLRLVDSNCLSTVILNNYIFSSIL